MCLHTYIYIYTYICMSIYAHTHSLEPISNNITKIRGLGYPWGALREPRSMALVLSAHPPRMWFRHRSKTTDRPKNALEDEQIRFCSY